MLGSRGNEQLDLENNIVDIQNLDDVSFYIRSEVSNTFLVFTYIHQVLTEPKNPLGKQYTRLFSMNNVSNLLVHANSLSLSLPPSLSLSI